MMREHSVLAPHLAELALELGLAHAVEPDRVALARRAHRLVLERLAGLMRMMTTVRRVRIARHVRRVKDRAASVTREA